MIVAYLINVRGWKSYREVNRVLLKIFSKEPIDFRKLAEAGFVDHYLFFFWKEISLNLQSECKT